jgi:hypothetical protein
VAKLAAAAKAMAGALVRIDLLFRREACVP